MSWRLVESSHALLVQVVGDLGAGSRMVTKAYITGQAKGIVRIHVNIHAAPDHLEGPGGHGMALLDDRRIRGQVAEGCLGIGDGPVAMGHVVQRKIPFVFVYVEVREAIGLVQGSSQTPVNEPFIPGLRFFFRTILTMPLFPWASYFAEGLGMTSMLSI